MRQHRFMIGAALLALAACGQSESAREAERRAREATAANITIATPGGRAEIRAGGAVTALPEGVPAYPGATTRQSVQVSGGAPDAQGQISGFTTGDSPGQVINFYGPALSRAGYTIANQMNMGPTATLTAQRGQGEAINIVATAAGGATQVQIIAAAGR